MISFTIRTAGLGASMAWQNIMPRFVSAAGTLVLDAIRALLGTDEIYILDRKYAERKPTLKGYRRMGGKPADQPLILSGKGIYLALSARREGDSIIVEVDPAEGVDDHGFDYAEFWEDKVDYLGKGLALVEDMLPEVLAGIIQDELGL